MDCTWIKQIIHKKEAEEHKIETDPLLKNLDILKSKLSSDYYYQQRCQELFDRYSTINLYTIEFVSIGETIPRLFNVMEDIKDDEEDVLNVLFPIFINGYQGEIYNTYIFRLFGRYLYFIDDTNIDLWRYILTNYREKIQIRQLEKYRGRRNMVFPIEYGKSLVEFTKIEEYQGKRSLQEMGIKNEFICLHAREVGTKQSTFGDEIVRETKVRNACINTYFKACQYMESLGVQSVRMGKYEREKCNIPNVIDYANNFYNEFMDFYLISKCKFMIGCESGLTNMTPFWGKPILQTNTLIIAFGWEGMPYTKYDMYILKKYYLEREKRYLNLYEMMNIMQRCNEMTSNYHRLEVRIENNTEEEIFLAVQEMNMRIDGQWVETEEEKEAQEKYRKIMEYWKKNHNVVKYRKNLGFPLPGYQMCPYKIAWSFLKENLYLVDIDDLDKYNYKMENK